MTIAKELCTFGSLDDFAININENQYSKFRVCLFSFMAAFSAINFGYSLSFTAFFNQVVENLGMLSGESISVYSSLVNIGAAGGALSVATFSLKYIGRRGSLIMCGVISLVGWLLYMLLLDNTFVTKVNAKAILYISRILTSFGLGASSTVANVYIAEISPPSIYQITGSFHQIALCSGFAIYYVVAYLVDKADSAQSLNSYTNARIYLPLVIIIIQFIQIIFSLIMPHSPAWLVNNCHNLKSVDKLLEKTTTKLYSFPYKLATNLSELDKKQNEKGTYNVRHLLKREIIKPAVISLSTCIILMFFQQFIGINPVSFNAITILKSGGVTIPTVGALIIGFTQLASSILSAFTNKYVGVKITLVVSSVMIMVSHIVLGIQLKYLRETPSAQIISVICLVLFYIAFNVGWGPIPYIMNSRLYPSAFLNIGSGIANMCTWWFSFVISFPYYRMEQSIKLHGIFFLFGSMSAMALLFSTFFVPEIHNKTKEEIDQKVAEGFVNLSFK